MEFGEKAKKNQNSAVMPLHKVAVVETLNLNPHGERKEVG